MTIKVFYWRGTLQLEDEAESYEEAMKIAARNQNAYDPTFFVGDVELFMEHGCLVSADYSVSVCGDDDLGAPRRGGYSERELWNPSEGDTMTDYSPYRD